MRLSKATLTAYQLNINNPSEAASETGRLFFMKYIAKYTFIHNGKRHRRGEVFALDADSARDLLKKGLIKAHELKKKEVEKPFALPVGPVLQPKIAKKLSVGKKKTPLV